VLVTRFARYRDVDHAHQVIMKCNKTGFNGNILTVKPASDKTSHSFTNESKINSEATPTSNQAEGQAPCRPKTILGQRSGAAVGGRGGGAKPKQRPSEQKEFIMPSNSGSGRDYGGQYLPYRRFGRGRRTSCWRGGGLVFGINGSTVVLSPTMISLATSQTTVP